MTTQSAVIGTGRLSASIRAGAVAGRPALIPFVTAGFPTPAALAPTLSGLDRHATAIEIGIPFSDPTADGPTIQRASRVALAQGITLDWVLDALVPLARRLRAPIAIMSYLNPLLTMGEEQLALRCALSGVAALIVPDLPLEESLPLRAALNARGIGLVQLVALNTPLDRAGMIARASDGFLYAVAASGVTGAATAELPALAARLAALRSCSPVPICAGFGIRTRAQVAALAPHADGVVIGSAVIEVLERGEDVGAFLGSLLT